MKKQIIVLSLFAAFALQAQAQVGGDTITVGNTLHTDSLEQYANDVVAWFEGCGAEGRELFQSGKIRVAELVAYFKGSPAPNSKEGVNWWVDAIDMLFGSAGVILTTFMTFVLALFKKDPTGTVSTVQGWFNKVRTRYLVIFSGAIVTIIGLVAFKEGGWTLMEAIIYLITSILGGVGLAEILDKWLGIKVKAKKVEPAA
jgi:hypothetical protein